MASSSMVLQTRTTASPQPLPGPGYQIRMQDSHESISRRSLTPTNPSVESLAHERNLQRNRVGNVSQRSRAGQSMRVGNVSARGLELRPVSGRHPNAISTSPPITPPQSPSEPPAVPSLPGFSWRDSTFSGTDQDSMPMPTRSFIPHFGPTAHPPPRPLTRSSSHDGSMRHQAQSSTRQPRVNFGTALASVQADSPVSQPSHFLGVSSSFSRLGRPQWPAKGGALLHSWVSGSTPRRSSHSTAATRSSGFLGRGSKENDPPHGALPAVKPRVSQSARPASPQRKPLTSSRPLVDQTIDVELEAPPTRSTQRAVIRLANSSGQVMAATPSGLVAQITSPNLLDYELLSDFFLTFRSFMNTGTLMEFLVNRLAWSLARIDDFGRIVRVRVFVALRHWILNYFLDDFMSSPTLRSQFCDALNRLSQQMAVRKDGGAGDLKIIGELKKCWRRTCALHCEVPEHKAERAIDDIFPGATILIKTSSVHDRGRGVLQMTSQRGVTALKDRMVAATKAKCKPSSTNNAPSQVKSRSPEQIHAHRISDESTHAVSCTLPLRQKKPSKPARPYVALTPVQAASRVPSMQLPPSVARSRSRGRLHLRNTSLTEPAPESQPEIPSSSMLKRESLPPPPLAGSLVRGALVLPVSPFSGPIAPPTPNEERYSFNLGTSGSDSDLSATEKAHNTSSPGVKRFLGSMRRALSSRQDMGETNRSSNESRSTTRQSPLMFAAPAIQHIPLKRMINHDASQPRIDVLGVKASSAYEDSAKVTASSDFHSQSGFVESTPRTRDLPMVGSAEYRFQFPRPPPSMDGLRMHSASQPVTEGSRSIYIIDGTGQSSLMPPRLLTSQRASILGSENVSSQQSGSKRSQHTISVGLDTGNITPPESPHSDEGIGYLDGQIHAMTTDAQDTEDPHTTSAGETRTLDTEVEDAMSDTTTSDASNLNQMPQLKRKPGGHLRNAKHVQSLHNAREARSFTPSNESSTDPGISFPAPPRRPVVNYTDETEKSAESQAKNLSLLNTHSSQPAMRPSFELEVAKLAQLPDSDEDGSPEATLRKLEGVYVRGGAKQGKSDATARTTGTSTGSFGRGPRTKSTKRDRRDEEIVGNDLLEPAARSRGDTFLRDSSNQSLHESNIQPGNDTISTQSTPLLERGAGQASKRRRRSSLDWLKVSLPPVKTTVQASAGKKETNSNNFTDWQQIERDQIPPRSAGTSQSFLLDENQSLNDRESPSKGKAPHKVAKSFYIDDSTSVLAESLMAHPLRQDDTPPRNRYGYNPLQHGQISALPLEDPATDPYIREARVSAYKTDFPTSAGLVQRVSSPVDALVANHLPFILGYPSLLVAQQFTLIEKDALGEVDWRELIDVRWKQSSSNKATWSECLQPDTATSPVSDTPAKIQPKLGGVDLCIERFNLMVKWTVSEIVLCEDISDRVGCIIKYIHIAQHARRLQNWATMYQITMALVSSDISRLKATWDTVPVLEKEDLKHLEELITPIRNFHNLRAEMETESAHPEVGCIPFIGLYTHDLIYNAQKPAIVQKGELDCGQEQFINFERCRVSAGIVKDLLRMMDSSSRYNWEVVPEVAARCLWMARLSDEEITQRSRGIEPDLR